MGDPGNPSDPNQPGWAAPSPPPPPPPADPVPPAPTVPAAPVPPAPLTSEPGGPAPVRKRRLTWLWILIPVLFVFLASLVLVIVFGIRLFVGPLLATEDYFEALRERDYAEAYSDRCASFQRGTSLQEFEDAHGNLTFGDFEFDNLEDLDLGGDEATARGTVEVDNQRIDVDVDLEREDGDWKVCRVSTIDSALEDVSPGL
jgi:hypothetical protein